MRGLFKHDNTIPGESFYYQHEEENLEDAPRTGSVYEKNFKSDRKMLEAGEWPWNEGVRSRLPDCYKKYWTELYSKEPIPVHYRKQTGKYEIDEFGRK